MEKTGYHFFCNKTIFSLAIVLLFSNIVYSQILPHSAGQAASSNMTFLLEEPADIFINPATNCSGLQTSISMYYQIEELNVYSLAYNNQFSNFIYGIGISSLSYETYGENSLYLNAGYTFMDLIQLGFTQRITKQQVESYQDEILPQSDIGFSIRKNNLRSSLRYSNIFRYEKDSEEFPVVLNWENNYKISENINLGIMIEKEREQEFTFAVGNKTRIYNLITVLCSYQLNPNRFSTGVHFELYGIELSYAIKTHQYLPLSHFISLKFL